MLTKVINKHYDKILHFTTSGMLVLFFTAGTKTLWGGVCISLGLGLWKEIFDGIVRDNFDWKDLVANVLGATAAAIAIIRII